jgi:hypothetical protein
MLGGPHSRSGHRGYRKNPLTSYLSCSVVKSVVKTLYWLSYSAPTYLLFWPIDSLWHLPLPRNNLLQFNYHKKLLFLRRYPLDKQAKVGPRAGLNAEDTGEILFPIPALSQQQTEPPWRRSNMPTCNMVATPPTNLLRDSPGSISVARKTPHDLLGAKYFSIFKVPAVILKYSSKISYRSPLPFSPKHHPQASRLIHELPKNTVHSAFACGRVCVNGERKMTYSCVMKLSA